MAATTNINGWNVGGNNNSFDQRGHFYRAILSGNVSGMVVKQNSTPNMTVLVEHGSALLNKNTTSASVAEIKADTSVTIDTANTANPRIDTVVIYEDTSVAIPSVEANYWQDGAGGRFKIVSLPGTAAASSSALSDANVQSAIGAGKPWARLADITVPANSTTIINSNIVDRRAKLGGAIPDASITAAKLDLATLKFGNYSTAEVDTGFTWVDGGKIYKKSISYTADTNNTGVYLVPTGVPANTLDNLVKVEGQIRWSGQPWMTPFPGVYSSSQFYGGYLNRETSDFHISRVGNSGFTPTFYITISYTKRS